MFYRSSNRPHSVQILNLTVISFGLIASIFLIDHIATQSTASANSDIRSARISPTEALAIDELSNRHGTSTGVWRLGEGWFRDEDRNNRSCTHTDTHANTHAGAYTKSNAGLRDTSAIRRGEGAS